MARPVAHAEPFRGSFVGREADVDAVEAKLARGARLVTLLGPGGVGKTRLLHRLVARLSARYASSFFVDLTSARSAGDVVTRVAVGTRVASLVASARSNEAPARVGRALAKRGECLLALDNLEQLEQAALPLLSEWLACAGRLVVLATSRVTLGVPGEVVYRLGPLPLVRDATGTTPAFQLFEERTLAVRGALTADEIAVAERLVALLEGMPLALEMAASRLALLAPSELLARLTKSLAVLTSSRLRDPDRHASVARVLDGSWELLAEPDRRLLVDLGVFVGGFTVEAAEAIAGADGDAVASLQRLVDSSLVRGMPSRTAHARHAPWEVVREYALEKLASESRLESSRSLPPTIEGPGGAPAYVFRGTFEQDVAKAKPAALEAARIVVERINGPVLMLAGADDQLWPACDFSARAMTYLTASGHAAKYEDQSVCFQGAGHAISLVGLPTADSMFSALGDGNILALGGTPVDNAHAGRADHDAVRDFLARVTK